MAHLLFRTADGYPNRPDATRTLSTEAWSVKLSLAQSKRALDTVGLSKISHRGDTI